MCPNGCKVSVRSVQRFAAGEGAVGQSSQVLRLSLRVFIGLRMRLMLSEPGHKSFPGYGFLLVCGFDSCSVGRDTNHSRATGFHWFADSTRAQRAGAQIIPGLRVFIGLRIRFVLSGPGHKSFPGYGLSGRVALFSSKPNLFLSLANAPSYVLTAGGGVSLRST